MKDIITIEGVGKFEETNCNNSRELMLWDSHSCQWISYRKLPDTYPIIKVPDNIKIEWCPDYKGIQFGGQCLWKNNNEDFYRVKPSYHLCVTPCQLIPCKREDLKAGDIAFISDYEDPDFTQIGHYAIFTEDDTAWYINENYGIDIVEKLNSRDFWWKVVPIEEGR